MDRRGNLTYPPFPDLLDNFLSSLPSPSLPRGRRRNKYAVQRTASKPNDPEPKSSSRLNVRTVVAKLTNAEVTDDIKTVRDCEKLLRNRRRIPIKYLQFCDNLRPGYYGKWFMRWNRFLRSDVERSLRHLDQIIRLRRPSKPLHERSRCIRLLV